jgi:hypothetical protein
MIEHIFTTNIKLQSDVFTWVLIIEYTENFLNLVCSSFAICGTAVLFTVNSRIGLIGPHKPASASFTIVRKMVAANKVRKLTNNTKNLHKPHTQHTLQVSKQLHLTPQCTHWVVYE